MRSRDAVKPLRSRARFLVADRERLLGTEHIDGQADPEGHRFDGGDEEQGHNCHLQIRRA
jgi:hypothetical protein